MKFKLVHPLWTHLPALLVLAVACVFTVRAMPMADQAPVHFNLSGQPDAYGSPILNSILLIGLSAGFLLLSAWLDELWARQENKKTFNWISLFDELAVGDLCGIQIAYVNMLASPIKELPFPWAILAITCGGSTLLAVALELLRPYRQYKKIVAGEGSDEFTHEIGMLIKSGQRLVYRESQNPAYAGALAIIVAVIMFVSAYFSWTAIPWLTILLVVIGITFLLTYGGFHTRVTKEAITVKMGILGIPLLRLKISDIVSLEVLTFSPLHDFGGYGIRFNSEMQAYYLKGDRGVKITSADGKKYLIGSDRPERLATVISLIMGESY
ncbi:MAG: DUF1648 domain-containing protein [Dehalococcoidia bacterium]